MATKRVLMTGITGQDGSYLAELLLEKGYEVHGLIRRPTSLEVSPFKPSDRLVLHLGDLTDGNALTQLLRTIRPDEVYNLAAQSVVSLSFEQPEYTVNVTAVGAVRLLEAIRVNKIPAKFYQASSSEMFGNTTESPQKETTPCHPQNPYGAAKLFAHWFTQHARTTYGIFACNGICFNHESPRRGLSFVTRKITWGLASILAGRQRKLSLGNLEAKRDWGYAKEYVEAMWRMLQQPEADDYVIATGQTHSIREFLQEAFSYKGLRWEDYVDVDPALYRPAETFVSVGNASKARARLGWEPTTTFPELVRLMVDTDLERVTSESERTSAGRPSHPVRRRSRAIS